MQYSISKCCPYAIKFIFFKNGYVILFLYFFNGIFKLCLEKDVVFSNKKCVFMLEKILFLNLHKIRRYITHGNLTINSGHYLKYFAAAIFHLNITVYRWGFKIKFDSWQQIISWKARRTFKPIMYVVLDIASKIDVELSMVYIILLLQIVIFLITYQNLEFKVLRL